MLVVVTVLAIFGGGGVTASCADADAVTHQSGESVQSVQHSRKMLWLPIFGGYSGGGGGAGGAAAAPSAAAAAAANRRAAAASYYAAARRGGLTSGSG